MSQQILKELLKPPFVFREAKLLLNTEKTYLVRVLTTDITEPSKTILDLEGFVAAALNEKWERDFGEPLRWLHCLIFKGNHIQCPKCKGVFEVSICEHPGAGEEYFDYCPHCGQRLLPPEGE